MNPKKPQAHNKARNKVQNSVQNKSHQIRIIGGEWKRTPLTVIAAEGLRPTPDRVRETVFNWINHLNHGAWQEMRCCDLFAGSGALGFEAASRGAKSVLMVEALTTAYKQLELTKEKLKAEQIQLKRGDAMTVAQQYISNKQQFELLFLDPPFHLDLLPKLLPLCAKLIAEQGLLYVESEQALPFDAETSEENKPDWCKKWNIIRQDKAGMVHFHLLQRNTDAAQMLIC
jgi:16S rRNA (guanine966-N2)-methyltransferase